MELAELIDRIRSHYVEHLLETVASQRDAAEATIVHEPALRDGDGEIVRSGPLDIPMRVDLVKAAGGEVLDSVNVDTEEMLSFTPFKFIWLGQEGDAELAVHVEPFQWNWLQVQTTASPHPDDWHAIRNWFLKWFGENDPAIDQLSGAVHFLDDPQIDDDTIQLTIDLGTAPVEAFEELLDALVEFGAKEVRVGQFGDVPTE